MKLPARIKVAFLVAGDIVALYLALIVALGLRYGNRLADQFIGSHLGPFTIVFPFWLLVFYVAGLYDLPRLRNNLDFLKTLALTLGVNTLITVALFYLVPTLGITPKMNLLIFIVVFATIESLWRRTFNIRASFRDGLNRVALLDGGPRAKECHRVLRLNPQFGYDIRLWSEHGFDAKVQRTLPAFVAEHDINLVVVPAHIKHNARAANVLYNLLAEGVEIHDFPAFYETVFRKVPLLDIEESWFIEHNLGRHRFYDDFKRGFEFIAALVLFVVLLPFEVLIAILIKFTSRGPVILRQVRVGEKGRRFILYKFRTMRALAPDGSAEPEGSGVVMSPWKARGERDPRLTAVGHVIAAAHLDELPQLLNILLDDLSFVGPRPERPEFTTIFSRDIPHYDLRHLVKPGITGWAQINFRYATATVADTTEKLQYDLYYLKNRSLVLDLAIILKTLKSFFVNQS